MLLSDLETNYQLASQWHLSGLTALNVIKSIQLVNTLYVPCCNFRIKQILCSKKNDLHKDEGTEHKILEDINLHIKEIFSVLNFWHRKLEVNTPGMHGTCIDLLKPTYYLMH